MRTKIPGSMAAFLSFYVWIGLCLPSRVLGSGVAQDPEKRRNVVILVADSLRPDVLGPYGGPARTPHIARLAEQGVLYERAYTPSPWTVPSSVALLTGNYPTVYESSSHDRSLKQHVPDEEVLLAEAVREIGYLTASMVENPNASWHNNLQGLDPLPSPEERLPALSRERRREIEGLTGGPLLAVPGYRDCYVVLDWLLSVPPDRGFFLLYWMLDPHEPYAPIPRFRRSIPYDPARLPMGERFYEKPLPPDRAYTQPEKEYNRSLYLGEVESVDERVGLVLAALDRKGLSPHTYVLLVSDHGEQFGENGLTGHGGYGVGCNFHETLVRVPLIIAGPGLSPGGRAEAALSTIDLMPALKDWLGLRYEDAMQGESLAKRPIPAAPRREGPLYFANVREDRQIDALLEGRYKLITLQGKGIGLYDLENDPLETRDVAAEHARQVERMLGQVLRIREENARRRARNRVATERAVTPAAERSPAERELLESLGYAR